MEIFEVLQILRMMHDVNHGFYIILTVPVSGGAYIGKNTTDRPLNVLANLILDGWGSRQGTDSPVYLHYDSQSRLGQMTRADDACSSDRWLRSC
jgi:hypothetical protein